MVFQKRPSLLISSYIYDMLNPGNIQFQIIRRRSLMPYFGGFVLVLMEVYFAVHAARRGRHYWIYIILFAPVVGCIAYFFVHVLPDLGHSKVVEEAGDKIVRAIAPTRNLVRLKEQLEFSDTIQNRQLLAKEYLHIGAYEDAITLFESCLEGIFEKEPDIIFDLANAHFLNGSYDEAKRRLLELKETDPDPRNKEPLLLLAINYEKLNDNDNALKEYKALIDIYPGQEARCRYAVLLKRTGYKEESEKLFKEIVWTASRSPRYYRRIHKKWIEIAKENLKETAIGVSQGS
jgi:hypothetical protein